MTRYFLRFEGCSWQEVSMKVFREAERAAGFDKPTGGFGAGSIEGRVTYPSNHDAYDWSAGINERLL